MLDLFAQFDLRRRELGISHAVLAQKAGISVPTVQRILSGRHINVSWSNVAALAQALGMSIDAKPIADTETLREQQAKRKAHNLVKMVQGTSGLEGQAIDKPKLDHMLRKTVHELLAGSNRKLWRD